MDLVVAYHDLDNGFVKIINITDPYNPINASSITKTLLIHTTQLTHQALLMAHDIRH